MRTPTPGELSQAREYAGYIQEVRWAYHSDRMDCIMHNMYYMLKPEIKNALEYLCEMGEIE